MKQITFRMIAYTDAAGKYNPDAPRSGNEDSFYVDDNLGDDVPNHCVKDEVATLSDCGLLMVVADGMGGMNAGEVASQIAIETVEECFGPGKITPDIAATNKARKEYMEKVIVDADRRIKADARQNPAHEGMGSTIIMAWVVGQEVTVSWCGDSRAYRFNSQTGIELLSEDHSYVQDLVRQGKLTYEATFNHPNGNIVTRSLGDPEKTAKPESRLFDIHQGDIIFLCSDGLSGVLRDRKTKDGYGNYYPGENLEDIIRGNHSTLTACRDALWAAAERAGWYDNVTLVMCEILEGVPALPPVLRSEETDAISAGEGNDLKEGSVKKSFWNRTIEIRTNRLGVVCFLTVLLLATCVSIVFWKYGKKRFNPANDRDTIHVADTMKHDMEESVGTDCRAQEMGIDNKEKEDDKTSGKQKVERTNKQMDTVEEEQVNAAPDECLTKFYIVKQNDTLYEIAREHKVDTTAITTLDGKQATSKIMVGDTLLINMNR